MKAELPVRGTHSSSAVNQFYQPYPGVGDRQSQRAVAPHITYSGPTVHTKSSEEMTRGYQQLGVGGYRPSAGFNGGPVNFDRSRMTGSSSQPATVETGMQRSAVQRLLNNQPVSLTFYYTRTHHHFNSPSFYPRLCISHNRRCVGFVSL